jgi:leucyl aminopeptidase
MLAPGFKRAVVSAWLGGLSTVAIVGAVHAQAAQPAESEDMYITLEDTHVEQFQRWQASNSAQARNERVKLPVLDSRDGISLSRVPASALPSLADYMHSKRAICGGYFAFNSLDEAQTFLEQGEAARLNAAALAVINYTVDNQAFVNPLLTQVSETRIRSTMLSLENDTPNRWFNGAPGRQAVLSIANRWRQIAAARTDITVTTPSCTSCGMQPNVVLTIPGSDLPNEFVILGAHADTTIGSSTTAASRAPGSDDDASGVASLTEALRVAVAAGYRPRRTVQIMAYAAEEVGLRGSRSMAQSYRTANRNVVGVLNLDLTNFRNPSATRDVYVLTDNTNVALTAFLRELFSQYLARSGLTIGDTACGYACSDHASWTQAGFPAAAYLEGSFRQTNQNIHSTRDTLATAGGTARHSVNFARLALAFMAEVAKGGNQTVISP